MQLAKIVSVLSAQLQHQSGHMLEQCIIRSINIDKYVEEKTKTLIYGARRLTTPMACHVLLLLLASFSLSESKNQCRVVDRGRWVVLIIIAHVLLMIVTEGGQGENKKKQTSHFLAD